MAKFPKLSHNAKLIGFNINDGKYGICLPYFITDIFKHDLQSHKTNHPNYSMKVEDELEVIQEQCLTFCKNNKQSSLERELTDLTDDLREYIANWDIAWLLRKSAIKDREISFKQANLPHP